MPFAETANTEQGKQPYKYNDKELDRMHGLNLYDYSARNTEPALGRFVTVDPLAEKYYSISPYVYCGNNPMRFVDSDGREWKTKEDEEYAKLLSKVMADRAKAEQKNLDKLNSKISRKQENGKDVSKEQSKTDAIRVFSWI